MSLTSAFGGGVERISFSATGATGTGAQGFVVVVSETEIGDTPEMGAVPGVHPAASGQSQMERALKKKMNCNAQSR